MCVPNFQRGKSAIYFFKILDFSFQYTKCTLCGLNVFFVCVCVCELAQGLFGLSYQGGHIAVPMHLRTFVRELQARVLQPGRCTRGR